MMAAERTPPKYVPRLVERALIEELFERHPERLMADELTRITAADLSDDREIATINQAICNLRECGVVRRGRQDQRLEPTKAALRIYELLMS
jgi:hypothetical protein